MSDISWTLSQDRIQSRIRRVALPFCQNHLNAAKPPSASYHSIGDHIRKARLDRGLLQRGVAQIIEVHATTVQFWEKGRFSPALLHIPRIIAFLRYVPWEGPPRNLGEKIARARKRLGITQEELAGELDIDPATLTR